MTHYAQLFLSAMFLVSCKSFQQKNIITHNLKMIAPTSYVFALAELMLLQAGVRVVLDGTLTGLLIAAVSMGTGAWIGCFIAIFTHDWMEKRRWN